MKTIVIDGIIGWDINGSFVRKLLDDANGDELTVEISSPGGFVYDGLNIFNLIRNYSRDQNKVTTKISGLAASMASYIALAGDRVIAEDNAVFMIHNVWSIVSGDYREMQKEAKNAEGLTNLLSKEYSKKTKKTKKEIRDLMDAETFYFGDEMVKAGFVDEIIKTEKQKDKNLSVNLIKDQVKNCFNQMKESERAKNDIRKAASLIPGMFDVKDHVKNIEKNDPEIIIEKPKMEDKNIMDEKMKAELESLTTENKALKDKLENIQAHLEFADIAPKEVMDAIVNEEEFSQKVSVAKYTKIQTMASLKENRLADDVGNVNVKPQDNNTNEEDTKSYTAKLKARRWIK